MLFLFCFNSCSSYIHIASHFLKILGFLFEFVVRCVALYELNVIIASLNSTSS